jgi:hypothetical protein
MGFDLLERSLFGGRPVAFVALTRGALVKRYVNNPRPLTYGGHTYAPLAIDRSNLRDSVEQAKSTLTITLPIDADCVAWWRPYPPSSPVRVVWLAAHRGDTELAIEWTGRVIAPKFTDSNLILTCEDDTTTSRSRGRILRWQRPCPHVLYSQGDGLCNADPTFTAYPGTVTSTSGLQIASSAFSSAPAGRLRGGFVTWTRPDGEPEIRSIQAHSGATITVDYGFNSLAPGAALTAYLGCLHNITDCDETFDNLPNHGGEIHLPNRNPMDGNQL